MDLKQGMPRHIANDDRHRAAEQGPGRRRHLAQILDLWTGATEIPAETKERLLEELRNTASETSQIVNEIVGLTRKQIDLRKIPGMEMVAEFEQT